MSTPMFNTPIQIMKKDKIFLLIRKKTIIDKMLSSVPMKTNIGIHEILSILFSKPNQNFI